MVVYVDDMYKYPMGKFGRMKMSHMISDNENELHNMADKIGIDRKWYQGNHYDISLSRRELAIQNGAIEITLKQLACMVALKKRGYSLGDPNTAIERFKTLTNKESNESSKSNQEET